MKRRDRWWVSLWLAPRAYEMLALIVAIWAIGALVPAFWWVGSGMLVLWCGLVAADALRGPARSQVTLERVVPEPFSLRRPGCVRYRVCNASTQTLRLGIFEAPTPLLRFDVDELQVDLPPRAQRTAQRTVTPIARGSGSLDELFVWLENPLGFLRRRVRLRERTPIRVYPDLSAVERYGTLHARNRLIEAGLRRMRLRGAGTEPETVREWISGDPFRSINWKATARRGKLMVAQYEVERSQNVMILLDAGRLMTARVEEQRKFDYAVTAALSVASVASMANDKVGVVAFASEIVRAFAPRPSGRSLSRIASEMYDIEPRFEESDYEAAFAYLRTHVRKRSLVVFFTDMIDPVAQSTVLAQIGTLCRRHVVVCAFMNDSAIDRALNMQPQSAADAYASAVALEVRSERRSAAATLGRLGVCVIDVPAAELTTALIDRYLQIKQRGLL